MNSVILWQGQSKLDTTRTIMAIATGFQRPSNNRKTGPTIQICILDRAELPKEIKKKVLTSGICGDCPLQNGTCYVNCTQQGYDSIWKSWQNGNITTAGQYHLDVLSGKIPLPYTYKPAKIRLGSYGDPVAIPANIWVEIFGDNIKNVVGYTHQFDSIIKNKETEYFNFLMISLDPTDSEKSKRLKKSIGRTFEAGFKNYPDDNSILCPNISGITNCNDCLLCSGLQKSAKNIYSPIHGSPSQHHNSKKLKVIK